MKFQKNNKILFVLRRYEKKFPESLGGVIASSEELINRAASENLDFDYVSTNKSKYRYKWQSLPRIFLNITRKIHYCDHIAMNLNEIELSYIAPYIIFLSKILDKKTSLRVFAGNIDTVMENRNKIERLLFRYTLNNVDVTFFETRRLIDIYKNYGLTFQFPTSRKRTKSRSDKRFSGKFIYFGGIKEEKGVFLAKQAIEELYDLNFSIDFWGVLLDGINQKDLESRNSSYKGIIPDGKVGEVLSNYDALLLPSYWPGEGYPGVIVEAFAAGIPVIASDITSFREMIDNKKNGFLVKPKDLNHLIKTLRNLENSNYTSMCKNSYNEFDKYCPIKLHKFYFSKICNL